MTDGALPSPSFTGAQRRALLLSSAALALGVATQALFWNARAGFNFLLWDLLLVGAVVSQRRGRIGAVAWGAALASALFALAVATHEGAWSQIIAGPLATVTLLALSMFAAEGAPLWQLPRTLWGAAISFKYLMRVPRAVAFTVKLPFMIIGSAQRTRSLRVLAGLGLGTMAAAVFVGLFSSDPEFAHWIDFACGGAHRAAWFGFLSLATGAGYLFVHALHDGALHPAARANAEMPMMAQPPLEERPDAAGDASFYRDWRGGSPWLDPALQGSQMAAVPRRALLSRETWGSLLAPVIAVFALFVALDLRHVFHGDAYVRDASGPSYSGYLHAGFYQLLVATILSVCLVLAGHRLLRVPGEDDPRVPGGMGIRALEVSLLGLTMLTLFSCAQRLAMYEEAYGATYLRLGVAVIVVGVLGVLALCMAKSITRRFRSFGGAVIFWLTVLTVGASAFNADAYIARRNLDRAAAGRPLDVEYLDDLSADARSALNHPYLADAAAAELREHLDRQWTAPEVEDWRGWRY